MNTDPQPNTTADRVNRLLAEGRAQEALEQCRQQCESAGAGPEDWLLYGCISADTGDTATGRMALEKAVAADPDFFEAQFGLGKLLAATGDHAAAIGPLRKAAQLQPDKAEIWLMLGITHGLAKQGAEAEECCRRALALQPGSADARFNLANAMQFQGKLDEAVAEYEAALKTEPRLAMAWSMLAQARVALGRSAEAEEAAQRALALEPRLGEAHFTLGNILMARGELEAARDHFRQAAEILPQLHDAHLKLGMILHQLGDSTGAAECYRKVLELAPGLAEAHFLLGEVMLEQKFPRKAAMSYRNALAVNNDHLQSQYRLAFLMASVGRPEEAAKHFAEVLRINPKDEQARHLLAAQQGKVTDTAPTGYVATLFDEIADTFDSTLVGKLNYRTPELLYDMVSQLASPAERSLDVIDLGCGTGLCAPLFRGMARTLHGVDLAPRMIEKARERNLYDALDVGDVTASLQAKTDAWDLVLSADVFVYIGDLAGVFTACASALRPGGLFAFSVEAGDDSDSDNFVLRQSGRYAHASKYIRSLASAAGLHEVGRRAAFLRHEKGKNVEGYLFLLRRPMEMPESIYRQKIEYVF